MSALCDRCQGFAAIPSLDAHGIRDRKATEYYRRPLGSIGELASSPCEVCQILSRVIAAHKLEAASDREIDYRQILDREDFENRKLILRVSVRGARVQLELHSHPSLPCPWGIFPVRSAIGPIFSPDWERKILEWAGNCASQHRCGKIGDENSLPTRVLDIDPLLERVILLESKGMKDRYVCLSHCWGGHQPLQTKTDNIMAHTTTGLGWNAIPKTYRDAIFVARLLGIRYIWIDSLCIVQDSRDDWVAESSQMARIYANSFITICATSSADCDAGFPLYGPVSVSGFTTAGRPYQVLSQRSPQHSMESQDESELHPEHVDRRSTHPLLTRAWCFQERLLSSRALHMCKNEMIWECNEMSFCECGRQGFYFADSHHKFRTALESSAADSHALAWRDVVSEYSTLSLTVLSDRLPALSGLASQMAAKRPGAKYLAGLWSDTIDFDLLWYSASLDGHSVPSGSCSAPTWSWVEKGSRVTFPPISHGDSMKDWIHRPRGVVRQWFKIFDMDCTPSTADPTGQVRDAKLKVHALVFETVLHSITERDCRPETAFTRKQKYGPLFHFVEFRPDRQPNYPRNGTVTVQCVRMALFEQLSRLGKPFKNIVEYVIVLERDEHANVYRRVGMLILDRATYKDDAEVTRMDSPFHDDGEWRMITIV